LAGGPNEGPIAMQGAPEAELIDLLHLDRPHVIGAWRVGEVLVDPGPASCLERLLGAIDRDPPRVIALTHIHLDHAGATGSMLRAFPDVEVWVHEVGAPHLADPGRLLASARRLYGEEMDRLWGEVLPVPQRSIRALRGGERLDGFEVAYTPGHASHHVAYLHRSSGRAFTGDVGGVRIAAGPPLPPTPPPDIDLAAWQVSLDAVEGWQPSSLAVTHFGEHRDVAAHIAALRENLARLAEGAKGGRLEDFEAAIRELTSPCPPEDRGAYAQAMPPDQSFQGLLRHLAVAARE
jgi:glyoxylase-like metal-dependent hydrolase (beta-lactamase superfamily II)